MSRIKKIIIILITCTILSFSLLIFVGYSLCKPVQTKITLSYGLPFDTVRINSSSGSKLYGWKLDGLPDMGVILLFHPLRGNRTHMVDRARFLWNNGYSVILFDFQAHGESEGKRISFGYHESRDVESIYDYTKFNYPNKKIGVIGISLGGAAVLLRKVIKPLDALILEAVYPTVEQAAKNRLEIRLGFLAPYLTPIMLSQLQVLIGITKNDLKPIDFIKNQNCPVLIIAGQCDRHTTLEESKRLFLHAHEPKEIWEVPNAVHEDFHKKHPLVYEEIVLRFFNQYLREKK